MQYPELKFGKKIGANVYQVGIKNFIDFICELEKNGLRVRQIFNCSIVTEKTDWFYIVLE